MFSKNRRKLPSILAESQRLTAQAAPTVKKARARAADSQRLAQQAQPYKANTAASKRMTAQAKVMEPAPRANNRPTVAASQRLAAQAKAMKPVKPPKATKVR